MFLGGHLICLLVSVITHSCHGYDRESVNVPVWLLLAVNRLRG